MFFADKLTLDKPRRNADGYMAIHARAARTGVYQYLGREVDPDGEHFLADQIVNVYRPADEVFDAASLGSFVGKPITDDHPDQAVTSENWRDLARGTIMGAKRETVADGDFVGFDLAFLDAATIRKLDAGKRELSNGYAAELSIEDGVAPDGTEYQAVQRNIRGNHVALVDAGRAGSECRVGDAKSAITIPSDAVRNFLVDQRTYEAEQDRAKNNGNGNANLIGDQQVPKIILVDGHQIDISNVDVAEATINRLAGQVSDAQTATTEAEAQIATLTTDNASKDAEIATLQQQVKDAQLSPADLRDAAKRYADTCAKAQSLGVTVADDASEADVRRAVVDAKLGDVAKDWTDAQVDASFAALTADVKPGKAAPQQDRLASSIGSTITPIADGGQALAQARRQQLNRKASAYLGGGQAN